MRMTLIKCPGWARNVWRMLNHCYAIKGTLERVRGGKLQRFKRYVRTGEGLNF